MLLVIDALFRLYIWKSAIHIVVAKARKCRNALFAAPISEERSVSFSGYDAIVYGKRKL